MGGGTQPGFRSETEIECPPPWVFPVFCRYLFNELNMTWIIGGWGALNLVYRGGGHSTPEARLSGTPHVYSAWNPGRVDPLMPHSGTPYVQECETTYRQNYTSNQHNDILQIGKLFCSILPISLQPIAYEKIHALHSNELAKGYTLIPITIIIDKCLLGDIEKLVVFSRICRISRIF